MDSSIQQLFSHEEILIRLASRAATGALHVFTVKEAANIFIRDGVIIATAKGLVEGEEVLKQVLEWKEARCLWQPELTPPPTLKPVEIDFAQFLGRAKAAPKFEVGGRLISENRSDTQPVGTTLKFPSRAPSTGPMPAKFEPPPSRTGPTSREVKSQRLIPISPVSATTSIDPVVRGPDTFEEALMRKHPLALLGVGGEMDGQRLRIIRASNLVGRNPACDFTLNHGSVSRQHCLLQITERGLHVKDLSTTNGTKVNGIKMTEGYVGVGEKLTIGHLDFVVEKDELAVEA
jgi:hypothetical protein